MENIIINLLSLVVALLTAVQSNPNLPPEVRVQALEISAQALVVAQAQSAAIMPTTTPAPVTPPIIPGGQPAPTTPPMTDDVTPEQPEAPATPTPFVHEGSVSAQLASVENAIAMQSGKTLLATITFKNETNEKLVFSGVAYENTRFEVSANSIEGWTPKMRGLYRSDYLDNDTRGIAPGAEGVASFILENVPTEAGTFDLSIRNFQLVGLESGERIDVTGFPIQLGTFEVS